MNNLPLIRHPDTITINFKRLRYIILFVVCCLGFNAILLAQLSSGGTPVSFSHQLAANIHTVTMPPVDVAALLAEDEANAGKDIPYRFGYVFEVEYGLDNSGTWEILPDGGQVWRLRIVAPGAYSVNLVFSEYMLPPGATLFIYNEDKNFIKGAFTEINNKGHGKLATGLVKGPACIVEYYEPAGVANQGFLSISKVVHGYRNMFGFQETGSLGKSLGFGDADTCNINVNCPVGEPWEDQKHSVVKLIMVNNSCSGALINNVRLDETPYFLSAYHCYEYGGDPDEWVVVFNYEADGCEDPEEEPESDDDLSGATVRARRNWSHFVLFEMQEWPPVDYSAYYAGWSNVGTAPDSSVSIHHPRADIKKISLDYDPAVSDTIKYWDEYYFWRVTWDLGIEEHGSSGSPLFDPDHRIVGNLKTGDEDQCTLSEPSSWYTKFSVSWDEGPYPDQRLKEWLDPDNTGATTFDGMYGGPPAAPTLSLGSSGGHPYLTWTDGGEPDLDHFIVRKTYIINKSYTTYYVDVGLANSYTDEDFGINPSGPYTAKYRVKAVDVANQSSAYSNMRSTKGYRNMPKAIGGLEGIPEKAALHPAYPNPFNPLATIRFGLPEASNVILTIYDILGQEVIRWEQHEEAGYKQMLWDGKDQSGRMTPTGIYIYRLVAASTESDKRFTASRKMVLMK